MKLGIFNSSEHQPFSDISPVTLLALAAVLIFINVFLFESFMQSQHVRACHSEAIASVSEISEEVNAAEYYEFTYRTCMRSLGEAI